MNSRDKEFLGKYGSLNDFGKAVEEKYRSITEYLGYKPSVLVLDMDIKDSVSYLIEAATGNGVKDFTGLTIAGFQIFFIDDQREYFFSLE